MMTNLSRNFKARKQFPKIIFLSGLILSHLASPDALQAQATQKINGLVTDAANDPVIGANVVIKGSATGSITDVDGRFILEAPSNAVLLISYIGYLSKEVPTRGQTSIHIQLTEDSRSLDEVVVIGYGVQKKASVIGSISQVSSEHLDGRPVAVLSNALAGQMPGVTLIQRSGRPGASPGSIRVRGVGSFGGDESKADALVLIDGIPGDINDVSPEEVASISVLKDASTAAIYGARASNGVILITTKSGSQGEVRIAYSGHAGFVNPTALPEYLPAWEYAMAYNEAAGTETYKPEDIQKFKDGSDPVNYPNSDFVNDIMGRSGFQTGHDLTLTGGTGTNSYYLAVGYLSQDGIVEKNNYSRYNLRINMTSQLTSQLKLVTRVSGLNSKVEEPAVPGGKDVARIDGIIRHAIRYPSVYAGKLSNGDYGIGPESSGTPVAWLASPSFYEEPLWKADFNARLEYSPLENLTVSAIGGYNFTHNETKLYRSTMRLTDTNTMGPSTLEQAETRQIYYTSQATVDYTKEIGGHNIGVLAGYSFEQQGYRDLSGSRDKFPGNDLPYMDAGSPDNQKTSGGGYEWAIQSYFGRLKYAYLNRYLLEATLRHDGSSRFPPTKKYATFPSLAAGWRITEESFMESTSFWLSHMKLKASWGILGNQNIGNYPWQSMYVLGENYTIGGVFNQGSAMTTYSDPTIHWESTRTTDAGVEFIFLKGLLSFNASYFYRHTTNILYQPTSSVSSVLGTNLSEMNTGSLKNTGWEFDLSHQKSFGDFRYNISANFSIINNEVLSLGVGNVEQPNGLVGNGTDLFIGYPMELYYGYQTDGVFLDQNDIDEWYELNDQSSLMPKNSARPGDVRYVDIDGDGKVTASIDRKVLGSRIPKYTYAFNLGFKYKGIDLSAFFQGVAKVSGRLESYAGLAFHNIGSIQRWMWEGRFNSENPQRYPSYPRLEILGNSAGNNGNLSDFWILDASYLRLKNVQLGYTLPKKLTQTWKMENLRFYLSLENPLTWSNYPNGWDPEINTDGHYYPRLATYTVGVNFKI
ncbi:MAG: TonB-dependent receptor [Tannerellaceae bacterium]|jgi:TonB-linked SusC/RagA family outer membrane protein|nr:TonB-dependent receptor [Tannerellaceae bacterium]